MKLKYFFQALVLVILLLTGWFAFILKMKKDKEPAPIATPTTTVAPDLPSETVHKHRPSVPTSMIASKTGHPSDVPIPEGWETWVEYLKKMRTPDELISALSALKDSLSTLNSDEQMAQIKKFLESGFNIEFLFSLQVGPDGKIMLSPNLRVFLIDYLFQLDPEAAAKLSLETLTKGNITTAAEQSIHLRNVAKGVLPEDFDKLAFLSEQAHVLLSKTEWIQNPTLGYLYGLDVINYTHSTDLANDLATLTQPEYPQMIRRTANLILERLVISDPLNALTELMQNWEVFADREANRAGLFARANPENVHSQKLLEEYITDPRLTDSERELFFSYFPNLNIQQSYDLISAPYVLDHEIVQERLDQSARLISMWMDDPQFSSYQSLLSNALSELEAKGARMNNE